MHRTLARRRRTQRVLLRGIAPENGLAFTARTGNPRLSSHERPSVAVLLEDGRPLPGPANALHDDIRQNGGGRFSFWHDHVYFAPTDNSDPRVNGRRYEIEYTVGPARAAALRVREAVRTARPQPRSTVRPSSPGGYDADLLLRSWRRLGYTLSADATILDFGCGDGERVAQLRRKGLRAFGCDMALPGSGIGDEPATFDAGVLPIETHAFVPFASVCRSYWWHTHGGLAHPATPDGPQRSEPPEPRVAIGLERRRTGSSRW